MSDDVTDFAFAECDNSGRLRLLGRPVAGGSPQDERLLAALAVKGTVTAADVPAILRTRRLRAGLVSGPARHPGRVDTAVALLPRLADHGVEHVVRDWDLERHTRAEGDAPVAPLPRKLTCNR